MNANDDEVIDEAMTKESVTRECLIIMADGLVRTVRSSLEEVGAARPAKMNTVLMLGRVSVLCYKSVRT